MSRRNFLKASGAGLIAGMLPVSLVRLSFGNAHAAGTADILAALPVGRRYYGGNQPIMAGGRPCRAGAAWNWPGGPRFRFLSPAGETRLSTNDAKAGQKTGSLN